MEIPATLRERLKTGKVIPFVGAGVSMAVRSRTDGKTLFPSWSQLLEHAANRLERENKSPYALLVRSLLTIDKPDLLRAAEYARDALGPVWFDCLKELFDHGRDSAEDVSLRLASECWRLGSKLVITTNYDRVLRWTCPEQYDLATWNIEAPAEQAALIRDGVRRPVVWHLHGNIDDAANLILTPDGYERLYPCDAARNRFTAGLETLRSLFASHSFLFIGFSLTDEAFGTQLKAISDVFAGANGPHYALIHSQNVETIRSKGLPGIEILPFPDYGAPLVELIGALAQQTVGAEKRPEEHGAVAQREMYLQPAQPIRIAISDGFEEDCDTPPPSIPWVGRVEELNLVSDSNFKVIAITGIGGQGKSTLAAKFLSNLTPGTFWDWRDCKEESNTLHTHLVRIIERITKGQRRAPELASERTESVIKLFFNLALSLRGVFVFDNIDQYIDIRRSQAVDAMHSFIDGAIRSAGTSKFIFTCRPKLSYESATYLQIELGGLTVTEAYDLFTTRGLSINERLVEEVHDLTQGHPLWINLIAKQALTNRVEIRDLISRIRSGKDTGLPSAMLQEIWRTLNPKHQKLLRYLAEMVRPETEKQLAQFVSKELNYNQFNKSLKQLKDLDLVVVKSPSSASDTIELHPLLREFVRRQFSRSERSPYISAIIVIFDKNILRLRPSLQQNASLEALQNWTAKTELLINGGDYPQALAALDEARIALLKGGLSEEFVRLGVSLFDGMSWSETAPTDSKVYDDVYKDLMEVLSQLGRFAEAEDYIRRFELTVSGATARYIALCEMRAHLYWEKQNFELAKEWGRRGVELKATGNLDTRHDCDHYLALAQRDSGEVEPALAYFLEGASIEDVVDPRSIDTGRDGVFYGNIGRCLYLQGDDLRAALCLIKSAWLLEKSQDQRRLSLQGWAALWLGDIHRRQNNPELAYVCYRRASLKFKSVSPAKSEGAALAADSLVARLTDNLADAEDWRIERKFLDWLNKLRTFSE